MALIIKSERLAALIIKSDLSIKKKNIKSDHLAISRDDNGLGFEGLSPDPAKISNFFNGLDPHF
jgi:hypothetical protein